MFLTAAVSSIAGAASAAGAGLSTLAAAGSSSGLLTTLSAGSSGIGLIGSLKAGQQQKTNNQIQYYFSQAAAQVARGETELAADDAELEATQEFVIGQATAAAIMDDVNQVVGGQMVAFAASGVDPTSGTALRVQEATEREGKRDVALAKSNANIRRIRALSRAAKIRRQGSTDADAIAAGGTAALSRGNAAVSASRTKALGQGLDFLTDVVRRG